MWCFVMLNFCNPLFLSRLSRKNFFRKAVWKTADFTLKGRKNFFPCLNELHFMPLCTYIPSTLPYTGQNGEINSMQLDFIPITIPPRTEGETGFSLHIVSLM